MIGNVVRPLALTFLILLIACTPGCLPWWSPISWSPDSSKVAFVASAFVGAEEDDGFVLCSGDIAAEKCTNLYKTRSALTAPVWSPNGEGMAFCEFVEQGQRTGVWLVLLAPGDPPTKYLMTGIAGQVDADSFPGWLAPAWRPDGKAVALNFASEDGIGVVIANPATGEVIWQRQGVSLCSWSPDGKWLVGALEGEEDETFEVVLISADYWRRKDLHTFVGEGAISFAWSPDSRRLCLSTVVPPPDEEGHLWVIDVATGKAEQVVDRAGMGASWSPDGRRIACPVARRDEESDSLLTDIVSIDPVTGDRKLLVRGGVAQPSNVFPSWSPDGQWIAYRSSVLAIADSPWSVVRLVSRDATRHKALYSSDHEMLLLAEHLAREAREGEPAQQALCRKEAMKLLRDLPKRFPDTKLAQEIEELEKKLEQEE